MIFRKLLLLLGCSASFMGNFSQVNQLEAKSSIAGEEKASYINEKGAIACSTLNLKKRITKDKKSKLSCIQLDFADIETYQSSTESEAAPGIEPDHSTRILGDISNKSNATYNPARGTIRVPPGIYSIKSCNIINNISIDLGDFDDINETISSSFGFVTFYYSLDRGQNWNQIIAGSSATVELFDTTYFFGDPPFLFNIRFPSTELLVRIKEGDSITFAYGVAPVNQLSTTVMRNFSGRFIVEQITQSED